MGVLFDKIWSETDSLTKETSEQEPERSEVVWDLMDIWGKSILGRGKRKYTVLEACIDGLAEDTGSFSLQGHRL